MGNEWVQGFPAEEPPLCLAPTPEAVLMEVFSRDALLWLPPRGKLVVPRPLCFPLILLCGDLDVTETKVTQFITYSKCVRWQGPAVPITSLLLFALQKRV